MGNAASIDPSGSDLDKQASVKVNRKGGGDDGSGSGGSGINPAVDRHLKKKAAQQQQQQQQQQKQQQQHPNFLDEISAITNAQSPKPQQQQQQQQQNNYDAGDDDDAQPVDVLLQFIPYYGQGDPANDSIVRATLNSLSVDEIGACVCVCVSLPLSISRSLTH